MVRAYSAATSDVAGSIIAAIISVHTARKAGRPKPMVPGIACMPPQRVTTQTQAAAAATSSNPAGPAFPRTAAGPPVTRTT
ncbi:hypothetical protein GCM10010121_032440 [Streptomyces brasiliensis]|uniref:Uncharacterized protein n=1 Tax=Streptomyces brasiliensis TaxID=1954 RepID=A0A917NRP8_9ACTN|nr:hypothetical protein GCM10010121_032440 [Streptomyces brasiliensis]